MGPESLIEHSFRPLYGIPYWGVQPGHGSFLTLEFGNPHLEIREPHTPTRKVSRRVARLLQWRAVSVHGDWYLWLYCCNWAVWDRGKLVGDHSNRRRMQRAADVLDGQMLTKVKVDSHGCKTSFDFDLGARLEVEPYGPEDELWMLSEPNGNVLVLRSDNKLWYGPRDRADADDDQEWLDLGG